MILALLFVPIYLDGQPLQGDVTRVDITGGSPTPAATATPASNPCDAHLPGWCWSSPNCPWVGPCTCMKCSLVPTPTPRPIATPTPIATAVPGRIRIDGRWFGWVDPAHPERCYPQIDYSPGGDPALYLRQTGHQCVADEWVNAHVAGYESYLDDIRAHGGRSRVLLEESSVYSWCVGSTESPGVVWPTIGNDSAATTKHLLDAGKVARGDFAVVVYSFGWANRESAADLALLAKNDPKNWAHPWARGATDFYAPGYYLDDPDANVLARDESCLDKYLVAMTAQHPEVGEVVFEFSTSGGAPYGYQGRGYEIAPRLLARMKARGYPPSIQIEQDCTLDPADQFPTCPRGRAGCAALGAAESYCDPLGRPSGAIISLWGDLDRLWQGYEACPATTACWH